MRYLLGLLLLITPVYAGSLGLSWNPVTHPTLQGYEVGAGLSPGNYTQFYQVENGESIVINDAPDACTLRYYAVRTLATGAGGVVITSLWSTEVSVFARPTVSNVVAGSGGLYEINGMNYDVDTKVYINDYPTPIADVTRVNCTKLTIPDTPFYTLKVVNPGTDGDLEVPFNFPLSAPGGIGIN
jgi:hypothetical protein